jgi:hypothetical protein
VLSGSPAHALWLALEHRLRLTVDESGSGLAAGAVVWIRDSTASKGWAAGINTLGLTLPRAVLTNSVIAYGRGSSSILTCQRRHEIVVPPVQSALMPIRGIRRSTAILPRLYVPAAAETGVAKSVHAGLAPTGSFDTGKGYRDGTERRRLPINEVVGTHGKADKELNAIGDPYAAGRIAAWTPGPHWRMNLGSQTTVGARRGGQAVRSA